jgi:glutamate dehydrogenase (NAD(P)+)
VTLPTATEPSPAADVAVAPPVVELTWTDPVTGTRGYLVVDRFIGGVASGGFRVREGLDLAEVAGLARAMTLKEAIVYDPADRYVPFGGAKGGLDLDPRSPDLEAILTRFLTDLAPVLRERWATGEDLGIRQEMLDRAAERAGLGSTIEAVYARLAPTEVAAARARLRAAFDVEVAGVGLADLVGGYGVAQAAVALATRDGRACDELTAVVQGFGSIGGATARYLAAAGVRVVGVVDRDGLLVDDGGLDVEALLEIRDLHGTLDRARLPAGVRSEPGDRWLALPVDVLVPAAVSFTIDRRRAGDVRASHIVEGANLPVLPDAERDLVARGVAVLPDFLANVGTNAWWWWVLHGDVEPTAAGAFERIGRTMRATVDQVARTAEREGISLRAAARRTADDNARRAELGRSSRG